MSKIKELRIYICEKDTLKYYFLNKAFNDIDNVEVVCCDVETFRKLKPEVEAYVSPGNSHGIMTGGYDYALSNIFDEIFVIKLQQKIRELYGGLQPIGESLYLKNEEKNISLIHTPTMVYPQMIHDYNIIIDCMKSAIHCAFANNIHSVVLPVFGGGCGMVEPDKAAKYMRIAYDQLVDEEKERTVRKYNSKEGN